MRSPATGGLFSSPVSPLSLTDIFSLEVSGLVYWYFLMKKTFCLSKLWPDLTRGSPQQVTLLAGDLHWGHVWVVPPAQQTHGHRTTAGVKTFDC